MISGSYENHLTRGSSNDMTRIKLTGCQRCGELLQKPPLPMNARYCSEICRFLSKVPDQIQGGCWDWDGTKHGKGYGHFKVGDFCEKAHRTSYRLYRGDIPHGFFVCHSCDNPTCVNPEHLFLGTNDDNKEDRQSKERQARGERSGRARLSTKDVIAIRTSRERLSVLSKRLGLPFSTVRSAALGISWRHLDYRCPPRQGRAQCHFT